MKNKRLWVSVLAGIMALTLLAGLIAGVLPRASAASSSELKNQLNDLETEQKNMQTQLNALKDQEKENLSEINDIMAQKNVIEQQVGLLHQQIDNINAQIASYVLLIEEKEAELAQAQARLAELNEKNRERIRAMEEEGQISYWSVLFQANSFSDLLDRLNMIQEIAAADRQKLAQMSQAAQEVEAAREALLAEIALLEKTKEDLASKQQELNAKLDEAQALLNQLLAKGEEFEALLDAQEQQLSQMEKEIAKTEQAYEDAKYKEWLATSVPPTTKPPAGGYGSGVGGSASVVEGLTWIVPCNYNRVSSPFGWRTHPVYGDRRFHAGVDLAIGHTPIYATRAGVVEISKYSSTAGYYVVINHMDGYKSTYMHMCKFPDVKAGEMVTAGQVIGCVGTTGTSTGYHLHFGISFNGTNVNPMDYIG